MTESAGTADLLATIVAATRRDIASVGKWSAEPAITCTGTRESTVVLLPSCPNMFCPQHQTVPSARTAHA